MFLYLLMSRCIKCYTSPSFLPLSSSPSFVILSPSSFARSILWLHCATLSYAISPRNHTYTHIHTFFTRDIFGEHQANVRHLLFPPCPLHRPFSIQTTNKQKIAEDGKEATTDRRLMMENGHPGVEVDEAAIRRGENPYTKYYLQQGDVSGATVP